MPSFHGNRQTKKKDLEEIKKIGKNFYVRNSYRSFCVCACVCV